VKFFSALVGQLKVEKKRIAPSLRIEGALARTFARCGRFLQNAMFIQFISED
jgi:hypothetical protein